MAKTIKVKNVSFAKGSDGNVVFTVEPNGTVYWDSETGTTYGQNPNIGATHTGAYGTFEVVGTAEDKTYSYTTSEGDEFRVDEPEDEMVRAYIVKFDASSATSDVTFDGSANIKLASVMTGSSGDSITVGGSADAGQHVDAGDGDDYVAVKGGNSNTVNLTLGDGADTVVLRDTSKASEALYAKTYTEQGAVVTEPVVATEGAHIFVKNGYSAPTNTEALVASGYIEATMTPIDGIEENLASKVSISDYSYADGDVLNASSATVTGGFDGTFALKSTTKGTHDEWVVDGYIDSEGNIQGAEWDTTGRNDYITKYTLKTVENAGAVSTVTVNATRNGEVYELKAGEAGKEITYVRTQEANVAYEAKEAIDFSSASNTKTLYLFLARNSNGNKVEMQASSGTVYLIASGAEANVDVDPGVKMHFGVSRNSSVTVSSALDASDTLYLADDSDISDYDFDGSDIKATIEGKEHTVMKNAMEYGCCLCL